MKPSITFLFCLTRQKIFLLLASAAAEREKTNKAVDEFKLYYVEHITKRMKIKPVNLVSNVPFDMFLHHPFPIMHNVRSYFFIHIFKNTVPTESGSENYILAGISGSLVLG